jgi:hypothetical protein
MYGFIYNLKVNPPQVLPSTATEIITSILILTLYTYFPYTNRIKWDQLVEVYINLIK